MKKARGLFVLLLIISAAAAAAQQPYQVKDALGRSLTFPRPPERIVLAGRAVVSLVNALYLFPDAGSRVIGVGVTDQGLGDFFPLLDPSAAEKARLPNDAGAERVAALKPDLVILKTYMRGQVGAVLEAAGIPVLYLDLETPQAFFSDIRTIGDVLKEADRARQIIGFYQERLDRIARAVRGAPAPRVLLLSVTGSGGDRAVSIPPAAWIQTWLVEAAGGVPVWKEAGTGSGWSTVGFERIASWNPEYILIVSYKTPAPEAALRLSESADWKALRAVKENKLIAFPADFYSWDQPDTRWILGLEWMARALHGAELSGMDLSEEVLSFYSELYGITRERTAAAILPRLQAVLDHK